MNSKRWISKEAAKAARKMVMILSLGDVIVVRFRSL